MGFVFWGPVRERTLVGQFANPSIYCSSELYCGGSPFINPSLPLFLSGSGVSALSRTYLLGSHVVSLVWLDWLEALAMYDTNMHGS